MSIRRRLIDLARANLNAFADRLTTARGSALDRLSDAELELELERRRTRRGGPTGQPAAQHDPAAEQARQEAAERARHEAAEREQARREAERVEQLRQAEATRAREQERARDEGLRAEARARAEDELLRAERSLDEELARYRQRVAEERAAGVPPGGAAAAGPTAAGAAAGATGAAAGATGAAAGATAAGASASAASGAAAGTAGAAPRPASPRPAGNPQQLARLYAQLECSVGAPLDEVKRSYRRMMRQYHPDLHSFSAEKQRAATELCQRLTVAYRELERHLGG